MFFSIVATGVHKSYRRGELISKLTEAERQLLLAYLQNKVQPLRASEDLRAKHPHTVDLVNQSAPRVHQIS